MEDLGRGKNGRGKRIEKDRGKLKIMRGCDIKDFRDKGKKKIRRIYKRR